MSTKSKKKEKNETKLPPEVEEIRTKVSIGLTGISHVNFSFFKRIYYLQKS